MSQTIPARELRPGDVAHLQWRHPETVERVAESDDGNWLHVYTDAYGDEAAHSLRPHHLVNVESREG